MRWDWRGVVGVILALGVAIAVVALAVGLALGETPTSSEEAALLSTALGAAVGAVATYLGGWHRNGDDEGRKPPQPPS